MKITEKLRTGERIRNPKSLVGKTIVGWYPRANYRDVRLAYEERWFKVESFRDTLKEPIEQATRDLDPLLRRGRFLLIGMDLEKREERRFYLASFRNYSVVDVEPKLWIEGYAQVVCRIAGGKDFVADPCIELPRAKRIAKGFNDMVDDGSRAMVHEIALPCFARDAHCKR